MENVVFVCTGNTCRSPMAEGYLKLKYKNKLNIVSRGIFVAETIVSKNSQAVMAEIGIDISAHVPTQMTIEDSVLADIIICLSEDHIKSLIAWGVNNKKIHLLGGGICDPYGGNLEIYRLCRDQIMKELDILIDYDFFSDFNVTRAGISHVFDIERLENLCFEKPWSAKAIEESMKAGTVFFVAEKKGIVLGYIGIMTVLDEGYITNIAVSPDHRREGIATLIIKNAVQYCLHKKSSFVSLEVRASNQNAISLYKKFDFKAVGQRKNFYENPQEDAIIMTRRLVTDENTCN